MNYKTTDYVKGVVYLLLGSISKPKYIDEKPTPKPGDVPINEYIVINSLPINADVMQKCYINVNYHVKDTILGAPDTVKIEDGSVAVIGILKKVTATNYLIDLESQETIREVALGEHYSNLRFSFKNINNETSLGSELVTNGGFNNGTGWSLQGNITIANGLLNFANANSEATQTCLPVIPYGKTYRVIFTISGCTAGNFVINLGGSAVSAIRITNNTFTEDIEVTDIGSSRIIYLSGTGFTGSIDNLSIKEIL
jgi:hypothetical protein